VFSSTVSTTTNDPDKSNNAASRTVSVVTSLPVPTPTDPGTTPGTTPPGTTPSTPATLKLGTTLTKKAITLSKGIPVGVTVTGAASVKISLSVKQKGKTKSLGSRTKGFAAAGKSSVTLKLSRSARKTISRLKAGTKLTLTVKATGLDGTVATSKATFKVTRSKRLQRA